MNTTGPNNKRSAPAYNGPNDTTAKKIKTGLTKTKK